MEGRIVSSPSKKKKKRTNYRLGTCPNQRGKPFLPHPRPFSLSLISPVSLHFLWRNSGDSFISLFQPVVVVSLSFLPSSLSLFRSLSLFLSLQTTEATRSIVGDVPIKTRHPVNPITCRSSWAQLNSKQNVVIGGGGRVEYHPPGAHPKTGSQGAPNSWGELGF